MHTETTPNEKKPPPSEAGSSASFRRIGPSIFEDIDKEPIPMRELFSAFGSHILKYKRFLLKAYFGFFVGAVLSTLFPLSTKFVIDTLIPSRNLTLIWFTAGALLALFFLRGAIGILCHNLLIYTGTHIVFDVRRRLFEHLQLLHLAFYAKESSGKLVSKLITDAAALQVLIQSSLPVLSVNMFTIVLTFSLMAVLSLRLTLLAMVILPAYSLVSQFFQSKLYRRNMQVRERNSVVAGNITEVISGIKVVKSFGMGDMENRRFTDMIRENLAYEMDLGNLQATRGIALELIAGAAQAMILLVGCYAVMGADPTMTVGDYVAFLGFVGMLYGPMQMIANLYIQLIQARTGLERILQILRIRPTILDRPGARLVERLRGHVRLEAVDFAYDEDGPKVIEGLTLEAQPGEIVALVGPSGSGKSSIVNLLTRFYDPVAGRVLVDDMDLRDLQLKSYQQRVGIVLQEPFLFSGTILDNICYGSGQKTMEQVEAAAEKANALEFIHELPEGFQTQVGERGQLLSGGQRQRIAIARALLKDPDILIFDEATSALDTESERLVQQALDRLMQGRTTFIVAHRLSTIRNADKIVVLDKGRISESGSHQQLLDRGGLYARLYRMSIPDAVVDDFLNGNAGQALAPDRNRD